MGSESADTQGEAGGTGEGIEESDPDGDASRDTDDEGASVDDGEDRVGVDPPNDVLSAIRYPFRASIVAQSITVALTVGSVLLVPALAVGGYYHRVSRAVTTEQRQAPEYEGWVELLRDGLRVALVGVVPFAAWVAIGLGLTPVLGVLGLGDAGMNLVGSVLTLGLLFAVPAFVVAFVGSDSVVDTFRGRRAYSLMTSLYYLKALVVAVVVPVVVYPLVAYHLLRTFLGHGRLVMFLGLLVACVLVVGIPGLILVAYGGYWGYVYGEAVDRDIVAPPAGEAPA